MVEGRRRPAGERGPPRAGGYAFVLAMRPVAGLLTLGPVAGARPSARMALSTAVAGLLLARSYAAATTPTARRWPVGRRETSAPCRTGWSCGTCLFTGLYALRRTGVRRWHVRLLAVGLVVSLFLAGPSHCSSSAPRSLGGSTGAAPASTPAAMTARVTVASTHG